MDIASEHILFLDFEIYFRFCALLCVTICLMSSFLCSSRKQDDVKTSRERVSHASSASRSKHSMEVHAKSVKSVTQLTHKTHSMEKEIMKKKTLEEYHGKETLKKDTPKPGSHNVSKRATTPESKHQLAEKKEQKSIHAKTPRDNRNKMKHTKHDDTSRRTRTSSNEIPKAPVVEVHITQSVPAMNLKPLMPTQEEEDQVVTLAKLDDEPSVHSQTPNPYEAEAGQKKMVVDPVLVVRRGNIDNIYTKMKEQFINQIRDADLPPDHENEKPEAKPEQLKLRFNDQKCVVYETNDEPTIDDMEDALGPEDELY